MPESSKQSHVPWLFPQTPLATQADPPSGSSMPKRKANQKIFGYSPFFMYFISCNKLCDFNHNFRK